MCERTKRENVSDGYLKTLEAVRIVSHGLIIVLTTDRMNMATIK